MVARPGQDWLTILPYLRGNCTTGMQN